MVKLLNLLRSKVNNVNLARLVVTLSVPSLTCGPGRGGQDGDQGWKLPSSLRRNCTRQAGAALLRTWPRPRGSQAPTRSAPPAPPPRPHQCIQSTVIQHWTSFILLFSGRTTKIIIFTTSLCKLIKIVPFSVKTV